MCSGVSRSAGGGDRSSRVAALAAEAHSVSAARMMALAAEVRSRALFVHCCNAENVCPLLDLGVAKLMLASPAERTIVCIEAGRIEIWYAYNSRIRRISKDNADAERHI